MGIRKRIILGFSAIGFLLIVAGFLSYFELDRLNVDTVEAIDRGAVGVAAAKDLLDFIQYQDTTLISLIESDSITISSEYSHLYRSKIDSLVTSLKSDFPQNSMVLTNELMIYINELDNMPKTLSSEEYSWYFKNYRPAYHGVANGAKDFLIKTQEMVTEQTTAIKNSAYRSNMQGISSLAAAVVLLIICFYLIDYYYISPIVSITKSLNNYLMNKVPFNTQIVTKDEVLQLKGLISQLIIKLRNEQRNKL